MIIEWIALSARTKSPKIICAAVIVHSFETHIEIYEQRRRKHYHICCRYSSGSFMQRIRGSPLKMLPALIYLLNLLIFVSYLIDTFLMGVADVNVYTCRSNSVNPFPGSRICNAKPDYFQVWGGRLVLIFRKVLTLGEIHDIIMAEQKLWWKLYILTAFIELKQCFTVCV